MRGDPFGDIYTYFIMRDLMWLVIMTEEDRRRIALARTLHADPFGEGVSCGAPRRPGGGDGGGPPGGGGDGGGGDGGPPARGTPWYRVAEESDDGGERGPPRSDLSFVESIFAFVFGRGDPNADLELRRWRAIGMLLRACGGAVFAEQVAPFMDEYLLRDHAQDTAFWSATARRFSRNRGANAGSMRDTPRDASRMHEGWMLPVLARFGGHAEASDDGRLAYVFPALRVTADRADAAAAAQPPPLPPPLYERAVPLWDGGDKQPLVIVLGAANAALLLLFRGIGGMSFADALAPPANDAAARAAAAQRARALGRRAGGGFASGQQRPRDIDPAVLAALVRPSRSRCIAVIIRADVASPGVAAQAVRAPDAAAWHLRGGVLPAALLPRAVGSRRERAHRRAQCRAQEGGRRGAGGGAGGGGGRARGGGGTPARAAAGGAGRAVKHTH